jgi:hypothetical protein
MFVSRYSLQCCWGSHLWPSIVCSRSKKYSLLISKLATLIITQHYIVLIEGTAAPAMHIMILRKRAWFSRLYEHWRQRGHRHLGNIGTLTQRGHCHHKKKCGHQNNNDPPPSPISFGEFTNEIAYHCRYHDRSLAFFKGLFQSKFINNGLMDWTDYNHMTSIKQKES